MMFCQKRNDDTDVNRVDLNSVENQIKMPPFPFQCMIGRKVTFWGAICYLIFSTQEIKG